MSSTIRILDTFWSSGAHLLVSYLFEFSYCPWGSPGKNAGVGCNLLLQRTMFYQVLHFDPFILSSWYGMVMAALSYASLFTMTRLWSMKRNTDLLYYFSGSHLFKNIWMPIWVCVMPCNQYIIYIFLLIKYNY